ncbi:MAG: hypothetical protein ACPGXK_10375 [Phycisphaerae bacterium]
MYQDDSTLRLRIQKLEGRLRGMMALAVVAAGWVLLDRTSPMAVGAGGDGDTKAGPQEIVASRIVIVDEAGRRRMIMGSDYMKGRVSHATGLFVFDKEGTERGGFSTMDDGSVVFALDAPNGVGSPMRDRLGMKVHANGAATLSMIDNKTMIPVRLVSDADGGGGLEFYDYDLDARKVAIKRVGFDGTHSRTQSLD